MVRRLKRKDQFQGARYELFAAATCIKANCEIRFEDEVDKSKKHVEFIATHKPTGQIVCVEAKSKHRKGILGADGTFDPKNVKLNLRRLINNALKKPHKHPLVIFIDLNLPPEHAEKVFAPPFSDDMKKISHVIKKTDDGKDEFSLMTITNYPNHYSRQSEIYPRPHFQTMLPLKPVMPMKSAAAMAIIKANENFDKIPNWFPKTKVIHERPKKGE